VTKIVNIVVVVLNDKVGLLRTLNSILDQDISSQYFRILVVDGFSIDGSFELATAMVGQGGYVFRSEPKGIYNAMNFGLEKVFQYPDTEGVLFLNAGDFFYSPSSVALIAAELELHTQVVGFSALLDLRNGWQTTIPKIDFSRIDSPVLMWLPHQSYCATVAVYKSIGVMDERFRVAGDVDWFMRAIDKIGIPHHIAEVISVQVVGGTSRRFAFLGYQERRAIALRLGRRVDQYPKSLVLRMFFSQKLGIGVPKFFQLKSYGFSRQTDSVVQRYEKVSKGLTVQEFPPED
jgi:glycosyltransferase involved in cell wall biosynthesis